MFIILYYKNIGTAANTPYALIIIFFLNYKVIDSVVSNHVYSQSFLFHIKG